MKKFMLAVAALVAVSSLSLVSCGKKDPVAMAKAAVETYNKAVESGDPETIAKAAETFAKECENIKKAAENAPDSVKVQVAAELMNVSAFGF